jgi:hypothetical protein
MFLQDLSVFLKLPHVTYFSVLSTLEGDRQVSQIFTIGQRKLLSKHEQLEWLLFLDSERKREKPPVSRSYVRPAGRDRTCAAVLGFDQAGVAAWNEAGAGYAARAGEMAPLPGRGVCTTKKNRPAHAGRFFFHFCQRRGPAAGALSAAAARA